MCRKGNNAFAMQPWPVLKVANWSTVWCASPEAEFFADESEPDRKGY
jgi:hypothetical protein